MEPLPRPFEILELEDRQSIVLTIDSWEEGTAIIFPKFQTGPKEITVVRVHVPQATKDYFPYYWDITAATCTAQLVPLLEAGVHKRSKIRITKHGVNPKARFTVESV